MITPEKLAELNSAFTPEKIASVDLKAIVNIGSQLTEDYVGKVKAFGYMETTMILTNDQIIRDSNGNELHKVEKGGKALSLALQFEDGANIALTTLLRSNKSRIGTASTKAMAAPAFLDLVGKTLKLTSVEKDASTATTQSFTNAEGKSDTRERVHKAYIFSVQ